MLTHLLMHHCEFTANLRANMRDGIGRWTSSFALEAAAEAARRRGVAGWGGCARASRDGRALGRRSPRTAGRDSGAAQRPRYDEGRRRDEWGWGGLVYVESTCGPDGA